jgi:hypothetical protein
MEGWREGERERERERKRERKRERENESPSGWVIDKFRHFPVELCERAGRCPPTGPVEQGRLEKRSILQVLVRVQRGEPFLR